MVLELLSENLFEILTLFVFPSAHGTMSNITFFWNNINKCSLICSDIYANREIFNNTEAVAGQKKVDE